MKKIIAVVAIILGIIVTFSPIAVAISWGTPLWLFTLLFTWIPGVNLIWKGMLLFRVLS